MGTKSRPKWIKAKMDCKTCGRKEIPTKTGECRICNPEAFYKQYPAVSQK